MIEDDADLAAFFDPDAFGDVAVLTPVDGAPFEVVGILEAGHLTRGVRQDNGYGGGNAEVSGSKPMFRTASAGVAAVRAGRCRAVIGGDAYTVHDVQPDGTGTTFLRLMKA